MNSTYVTDICFLSTSLPDEQLVSVDIYDIVSGYKLLDFYPGPGVNATLS